MPSIPHFTSAISAFSDSITFFASVLLLAFLGSVHCMGMCGGIAALATRKSSVPYQSGRLMGYLTIGVLVGIFGKVIGQFLENHPEFQIAGILITLLLFGIQAYFGWVGSIETTPILRLQNRFFRAVFAEWSMKFSAEIRKRNGFVIGLTTALIPCGWIGTFVLIAAATGSFSRSVGVFFLLWAGTLPALIASNWGIKKMYRRGRHHTNKFIVLGILAVSLIGLSQRIQVMDGKEKNTSQMCGH